MDETFYSKPHANHHTLIHGLFSKPVWQSHTHSGYIGATHGSVSLTCGLEEPDTETLNVRPTSNKTHKVTSAWEVTMNCVSGHEHSLGVINWKLLTFSNNLYFNRTFLNIFHLTSCGICCCQHYFSQFHQTLVQSLTLCHGKGILMDRHSSTLRRRLHVLTWLRKTLWKYTQSFIYTDLDSRADFSLKRIESCIRTTTILVKFLLIRQVRQTLCHWLCFFSAILCTGTSPERWEWRKLLSRRHVRCSTLETVLASILGT